MGNFHTTMLNYTNYHGAIEVNLSVKVHAPPHSADIAATPRWRRFTIFHCMEGTRWGRPDSIARPIWIMIHHGISRDPSKVCHRLLLLSTVSQDFTTLLAHVGKSKRPTFSPRIFWLLMWLALASVLGEDVGGERLIMHPCFESLLTKRYKSRVWCPDLHAPNDHAVLVMGDG